jgi:hypothetical protein
VGQEDVAHVSRAVDPVARLRVAARLAVWWPCPGTRARNARSACACSGVLGAVTMRSAFGARKDPGRLVVPDRLRGQPVPARQVNRPEPSAVLRVSPHCPADVADNFQLSVAHFVPGSLRFRS